MWTNATTTLSCTDIQRCHASVDCTTGTNLGIPSFVDNQCSFQQNDDSDDAVAEEDFVFNPGNNDDGGVVTMPNDGRIPKTVSPTISPTNAGLPSDPPTTVPMVGYDNMDDVNNDTTTTTTTVNVGDSNKTTTTLDDDELTANNTTFGQVDASSTSNRSTHLSPLNLSLIVIGCLVVVVTIQITLYQKGIRMAHQNSHGSQQQQRISEEIIYTEPLEFDGIEKILSSDAIVSQKTATGDDDEHTTTISNDDKHCSDNDMENPKQQRHSPHVIRYPWLPRSKMMTSPPPTPNSNSTIQHHRSTVLPVASERKGSISLKQEIRHFQTASILERPNQNEVEALYMTGQHHIQLPS
jgi:hypothetical protein